jgi:hypothetical protein
MPALRELQPAVRAALLGEPGGAAALAAVPADGLTAEGRLAIYRHHVLASLGEVLDSVYPVVRRLVGEGFFAYAADAFIRRHPPTGPCLFEYGAAFADFLAAFPPCQPLAYLPDVARLEWAIHAAAHAPDAVPLDCRLLADLDPSTAARLMLAFDPSVAFLASPWPVDRLWRANQPEAPDPEVDLAAGGAWVEVRRVGEEVAIRSMSPDLWAFSSALARGLTLAEAAAAAFERGPDFDLAAALRGLLEAGVLTAFTLRLSPKETRHDEDRHHDR